MFISIFRVLHCHGAQRHNSTATQVSAVNKFFLRFQHLKLPTDNQPPTDTPIVYFFALELFPLPKSMLRNQIVQADLVLHELYNIYILHFVQCCEVLI